MSLAQSLPPKIPADILLLGCGDVRNILFTNHVDGQFIFVLMKGFEAHLIISRSGDGHNLLRQSEGRHR